MENDLHYLFDSIMYNISTAYPVALANSVNFLQFSSFLSITLPNSTYYGLLLINPISLTLSLTIAIRTLFLSKLIGPERYTKGPKIMAPKGPAARTFVQGVTRLPSITVGSGLAARRNPQVSDPSSKGRRTGAYLFASVLYHCRLIYRHKSV